MKKLFLTVLIAGVMGIPIEALHAADPELDPAEATVKELYLLSGNWSQLKRGWNTLILKITDPQNQVVVGADVKVVYDMVGMPMSPPDRAVVEKGDGIYEKRVFLGMSGAWKFDTTINPQGREDTHTQEQKIMK